MNESISLAFNDLDHGGSSDKVYHIVLGRDGDTDGETYSVAIQYGRRGSALMSQTKARHATYAQAKKVYDKVLREKLAKGYRPEGQAPAPQVAPSSGIKVEIKPPELLEEVTNGDVRKFLEDPAYWAQDKSDGVSRGVVKAGGEIFGINKRGLPVPLPAELVGELSLIFLETFQLDAELVGNKLIVRDILVANVDVSQAPYYERFALLHRKMGEQSLKLVSIVQTWTGAEKAPALERARAERREGVVFKLTSAPYRAGRNGQHKKYKFIKTLSAIAGKPKANGKESVELFLIEDSTAHPDIPRNRVRCGTVSLIGKPKVQEGDVVEVSYLYAMSSGIMQQARLLSVRTDVDQSECTTTQLIFKREESDANE